MYDADEEECSKRQQRAASRGSRIEAVRYKGRGQRSSGPGRTRKRERRCAKGEEKRRVKERDEARNETRIKSQRGAEETQSGWNGVRELK